MSKCKANQYIPKIIADLSEGRYSLRRVPEGERGPSRLGRIKKLLKKLKKKWIRPWTVMEVLYNRTYKVADHMGVRK